MDEKNYTVSQFAKLLNVSVKTLQRWDREGILVARRTPTNRRYYTGTQYDEYQKQGKEGKRDAGTQRP